MRKSWVYILFTIIIAAVITVVVLKNNTKKVDRRIYLRKDYATPYGTSVFYKSLKNAFPKARISVNKKSPDEWMDFDSVSNAGKSLYVILSDHFDPNYSELYDLFKFAQRGNNVLLITEQLSDSAAKFFYIAQRTESVLTNSNFYPDSVTVKLDASVFGANQFFNPGFSNPAFLIKTDTVGLTALGFTQTNKINFARLGAGSGFIYFHTDPFLFANYFLLHPNNDAYLNHVLSLIPDDVDNIIWDDYFFYTYQDGNKKEPNPFRVLMAQKAFKAAFTLLMVLLAVYLLLNIKRKQRFIPFYNKPKNESLEFAKTIGSLYYQQADHANLAKKMTTYLLDFIRSKYFLVTSELNDEFINRLMAKTGYEKQEMLHLVEWIGFIKSADEISEQDLAKTYKLYYQFYKHVS